MWQSPLESQTRVRGDILFLYYFDQKYLAKLNQFKTQTVVTHMWSAQHVSYCVTLTVDLVLLK